MCSDSFELKAHQQVCQAYRVYSDEHVYATDNMPGGDVGRDEDTATTVLNNNNNRTKQHNDTFNKEHSHDTPDSTSTKQDLLSTSNERTAEETISPPSSWRHGGNDDDNSNSPSASINDDTATTIITTTENNTQSTKTNNNNPSELDDLIGEDTNNSFDDTSSPNDVMIQDDEQADPETEAMIGVDESSSHMKPGFSSSSPSSHQQHFSGDDEKDSKTLRRGESELLETSYSSHSHRVLIKNEENTSSSSPFDAGHASNRVTDTHGGGSVHQHHHHSHHQKRSSSADNHHHQHQHRSPFSSTSVTSDNNNSTSSVLSFLPRPSHLTEAAVQAVAIENVDMNKKYQPYFCKNCGARFTRKDSVTRHLKKGTCSGKSAIVCSICGKVFPEYYELQQHFKLDHKNMLAGPPPPPPSSLLSHRAILPKPNDHHHHQGGSESSSVSRRDIQPPHYSPSSSTVNSSSFLMRDQHLAPLPHIGSSTSRGGSTTSDQQYRQRLGEPRTGQSSLYHNQSTSPSSSYQRHQQRYPPSSSGTTSQYRDHHYPSPSSNRQYDPSSTSSKYGSPSSSIGGGLTRKGDSLSYDKKYHSSQSHHRGGSSHIRKREYGDYIPNSSRDPLYSSDISATDLSLPYAKRNKYSDYDGSGSSSLNSSQNKSRLFKGDNNKHHQINLSEYTNNAMKSEQYFSKRFIQKDGVGSDNEPGNQIHQCKICGNEFPRFEYLLTHLRKHKEKQHQHAGVDGGEEHGTAMKLNNEDDFIVGDNKNNENTAFVNANSPEISRSGVEVQRHTSSHYESQLLKSSTSFDQNGHDTIPIVVPQPPQQPPPRFSDKHSAAGSDIYHHHHSSNISADHQNSSSSNFHSLSAGVGNENPIDAITPGVDGKFRPFICENCGQRFTRKDSLVRHAKKQTCYEEQIDLKCKHCDKTFRYHKCLIQHQELVHGISREEQSKSNPMKNSDDEDTDSDRSYEKMDLNFQSVSRSSQQQHQHQHHHHEEKENTSSSSYPMLMESDKKYRPSNTMLDSSSKSSVYQHHQQPWSSTSSSSAARGVANSVFNAFSKLVDPSTSPSIPSMVASGSRATPKFIPPARGDEKSRKHHQMDPSTSSGAAPSSNNNPSQDGQYIGYCTVARPFQCDYCGDRFAHRHSLKRHIRRHLGIGIPCVECGKLYRDQSEWRRHQKSIHNRHYEKYEVPSRISYRDGMENGMIGVVPSTEYHFDHNEGSDSEKSEEESMSMVKNSKKLPTSESAFSSNNNNDNNNNNNTAQQQTTLRKDEELSPSYNNNNNNNNNTEQQQEDDENNSRHSSTTSKSTFNFNKLNNPPPEDKDSRKSALDRYLQSTTHSDDEGDHDDRNTVETTSIPKVNQEGREDNLNNEEKEEQEQIEQEDEENEDQMANSSRDGDTSRESLVEHNNNNNNEETSNNNNNNNDTKFSSFHDNSSTGGDGNEIVMVVGDGH